ncbi:MAG: hypothetical protein K1X88_32090 [Nannocystaceae bacterium]|nr:hypothetical protein [Nannocystaceae bacterium]
MAVHCERCSRETVGVYEHPRARRLARGYLLLPLPFLPFLPIIGADYAVMLPLLMAYMLGIGPVLALIQQPASCEHCGANVARPR